MTPNRIVIAGVLGTPLLLGAGALLATGAASGASGAPRPEASRTASPSSRSSKASAGPCKSVKLSKNAPTSNKSGATGSSGASGVPSSSAAEAVAAKIDPDLVDVNTNLAFENAAAAGTGIVVGSGGCVLTNNHVIRGATTIKVTDLGNHKTYSATVVGYDLNDDVALLALSSASHLHAAPLGNSKTVKKGTPVVAIGNAGGRGGKPTVTAGAVTGTGRQITASDSLGGSERLSGMLETNASLQPGDSGGPLVDAATGTVIGMDTAGSPGFVFQSGGGAGYAIPTNKATSIGHRIAERKSSPDIHVGPTPFLGVTVTTSDYISHGSIHAGVVVASTVPGGPAAQIGLSSGDVITSIAGKSVSAPPAITSKLLTMKPGQSITVKYLTQSGASKSGSAKLVAGPPQ